MTDGFKKTWTNLVQPMLRRPRQLQVAAICYRERNSETEVLLITSRGTGRWIVPKGWPIDGLDALEAALQEAWEEAGVRAIADTAEAVGSFEYEKWIEPGYETPIEAQVFKVKVDGLEKKYPEVKERKRKWFTPAQAANLVDEPGLQEILRHF